MGLESVRQAQYEEQTEGFTRYHILETEEYRGGPEIDKHTHVMAENVDSVLDLFVQRHGTPLWRYASENVGTAVWPAVENGNNPYKLVVGVVNNAAFEKGEEEEDNGE